MIFLVKLAQLKNDQQNRRIREVITSTGNTINVYEPTKEQIDEIIGLQARWVNKENDALEISGIDIVRILFPMLSDIEGIDELTDEEIEQVILNPTNALIQLQYAVETVISEVYKTAILQTRKELLETDFQIEAYKISEETFDRAIHIAAKNTGSEALLNKIEAVADDMEELNEKEETHQELQEELSDTQKVVSKYQDELDQYKKAFATPDDNKIIEFDRARTRK